MGRTVADVRSREEIAERLAALARADRFPTGVTLDADEYEEEPSAASLDFELNFADEADAQDVLHTLAPPELPEPSARPGRPIGRNASVLHLRMRGLIQSVESKPKSDQVTLEQRQWQNLIDLQDRLAGYLRQIGEPSE